MNPFNPFNRSKGRSNPNTDDPRYKPFTLKQQLLSTGVSVGVALLILWATQSVVWGFVTFFVLSIAVNAVMLGIRDRKQR